jgi:hypothetical protein
MYTMKIKKVSRNEDGTIVYELENGEEKHCLAAIGGISWPLMVEGVLSYYCILAEESISAAQRKEGQRGKLIVVREYEDPDILSSGFSKDLTDYAKLLECSTFYTVTKEFQERDYSADAKLLRDYAYKKQSTVHLEEAPLSDRPDLGLRCINKWTEEGLLKLPEESLLYNQLKNVLREKADQVPQMFNAVNALRFVVCGFDQDNPAKRWDPNWRDKMPKGTWRTVT